MPLETVKLTASFKLNGSIPEGLFSTYREVLSQLLDYAWAKGITSFKRLKAEKYRELRAKYPRLPSHYIYTACQMACHVYKSFGRYRQMKCSECGLEEDRDVIAVKNPLRRYQMDAGAFVRPSHEKRREGMKVNARPERWSLAFEPADEGGVKPLLMPGAPLQRGSSQTQGGNPSYVEHIKSAQRES